MSLLLIVQIAVAAYLITGIILACFVLFAKADTDVPSQMIGIVRLLMAVFVIVAWPFIVKNMNISFKKARGFKVESEVKMKTEDEEES